MPFLLALLNDRETEMRCPRCQQDNPSQARFCLGCGMRLTN